MLKMAFQITALAVLLVFPLHLVSGFPKYRSLEPNPIHTTATLHADPLYAFTVFTVRENNLRTVFSYEIVNENDDPASGEMKYKVCTDLIAKCANGL